MRTRWLNTVVLFALVLGVLPLAASPSPVVARTDAEYEATYEDIGAGLAFNEIEGTTEPALYVIRLHDPPLARYEGDIAGLAATSPRVTGKTKLDVNAAASVAYLSYLEMQQRDVLRTVEKVLGRSMDIAFQYRNVLNGFAVTLTPEEAAQIARLPDVLAIYRDVVRELDTDVGPALMGAPTFWDGELGFDEHRGEGVIVGMLDSGVNHEHPSFAAVDGDGYEHQNPYGAGVYVGVCQDDTAPDYEDICNEKLIGAWNLHPDAPSAVDWNNHGSHVGSTIAGNRHDAVFPLGTDVFTRTISGVAPRANVISYLVCFPSCPSTSSAAAVDQAIADGVDVLNYSISGSDDPWNDIVDLAFLDAYAAGMFVSASAGNDGPGTGTVAKTGPWNASVAASTHNRVIANTVDVTAPTEPAELQGMAAVPGTGPGITGNIEEEIIWAGDAAPGNIRGCDPFPADSFTGAIALIQRGDCSFESKVNNADSAGAIATIVYNHVGGPPISMGGLEGTPIPAVFIDQGDGEALADFISNNTDPEVRINAATSVVVNDAWQDVIAGFSSRGPSQWDLLKPDYTAPGVNILAAGFDGPDAYAFLQGTSMSSPHAAGAAALMVQRYPDWSPAEVKSALAMTAWQDLLKEDGVTPADFFDMGSGRIDLTQTALVGLVMDETVANYEAADPTINGEPRNLNQPSLVDQNCVDTCSWTRTVRSVLDVQATYTATATAPTGMTLSVTPTSFTINPDATQELEITVDVDMEEMLVGAWTFAQVHLEAVDVTDVTVHRLPLAIRPMLARPVLILDPTALDVSQLSNTVTEDVLTIGNAGGLALDWEFASSGSGVIWDQPRVGTSGRINNFSDADDTGIYQSSVFQLYTDVEIETIFMEGFALGTTLADATGLNWYIYEDADGSPAGNPEDGLNLHSWSYTATVGSPGVSITDENMALDLVSAGEPPISLSAGTYWLLAYPDLPSFSVGPNILYAWFHSGTGVGQQIGPGGLLGWPTTWASVPQGRAFHLGGQINCGSVEDIPWLTLDPTSGLLAPESAQNVDVTIDSTDMAAGIYNAALCLATNDPENELVMVPVTLTVQEGAEIEIAPAVLSSTQPQYSVLTDTLTISNTGFADLDWEIEEEDTGIGLLSTEVLYDQMNNTTTSGALAIYDLDDPETWAVQAADDFVVPANQIWQVHTVFAGGFYGSYINPPQGVNVFFYADDGGLPGDELYTYPSLPITTDDQGNLTIDLATPAELTEGTYWVSVQPRMDFFSDGRWFWFMESVQTNSEFAWRNPGDGYSTGCDTWGSSSDCGFTQPDLTFQIIGERSSPCLDLSEITWLSVDPTNGTTIPGASDEVIVAFDASDLAAGEYAGNLCVFSNDPATPLVIVPVSMDVLQTYTLDVDIVGDGSVEVDPEQNTYLYSDVVALTATADTGWAFNGWSGDVTDTDEAITITIEADTTVTATFEAIPYTFDVDIVGDGSVEVDPDQDTYLNGDVVTLTATAGTGWAFDGWSGDVTDTDEIITITIEADTTITATFIPVPNLAVTKAVIPTADLDLGDTVTYTIRLVNIGEGEAVSVQLTDTLPSGVSFATFFEDAGASHAAGVIVWSGDLAAGETLTIVFTVTVDDDTELYNTTITNTVTFTSDNAGDSDAEATFAVRSLYKLVLPLIFRNYAIP